MEGGELPSRRKLDFHNDVDSHESSFDGENIDDQDVNNGVSTNMHDGLSINQIHSKLFEMDIPKVGMEFKSEEEAYQFYNGYAKKVGFGIRRSRVHRDEFTKKILDRMFCCSREGIRGKDKRDANVKNIRPESRCFCLANMKISCPHLIANYEIVEFVAEHNHSCTTPSKTHLYRSHRKISLAQVVEADMAESSGIAPKAALEFMARQIGGRENLGFIPEDYRNYLQTKRTRYMRSGDTGGVLEYLQNMKSEDPNFFYGIQVDEDDMITNVFWEDSRMMIDFAYFGDVVCFDTTYRTNKDGRPFGLFVGVNHHKQTIVFGASLLYDETIPTFKWLFNTFAKAMSGKKRKTILTDQDAAMANALASQWPETYHRLCIWHIYQNAATHLSGVFKKFKDFIKDFSSCIYNYEDEEDFLVAWNEMLEKFGLEDNEWLKGLFGKKEKWALVYGRNTFCADMTTTQRSESMNSVLKRYVSYKHDLFRFFEHFQRLLNERRYEESRVDFRANQTTPSMTFAVEIIKHASSVYTPAVLKSFQGVLFKSYDSNVKDNGEVGTVTTYEIRPYRKKYFHTVSYDSLEDTISCSCKKFEFAGFLCSHALKVLSVRNITEIPHKYILKRWTREAKKGIHVATCEIASEVEPKAMMGIRYRELCSLSRQLVTQSSESEKTYEIVKQGLIKLLDQVDNFLEEKPTKKDSPLQFQPDVCEPIEHPGNSGDQKIKGIRTKQKAKNKSSKRKVSALEKAVKKKRSKKNASKSLDDRGEIQNLDVENDASSQVSQAQETLQAIQEFNVDGDMMNMANDNNFTPSPPLFSQVSSFQINESSAKDYSIKQSQEGTSTFQQLQAPG